jgi:hypothetical protein
MTQVVSTRRLLEQLLARHQPAKQDPTPGHTYRWARADPQKTRMSWLQQQLARCDQWKRSA